MPVTILWDVSVDLRLSLAGLKPYWRSFPRPLEGVPYR